MAAAHQEVTSHLVTRSRKALLLLLLLREVGPRGVAVATAMGVMAATVVTAVGMERGNLLTRSLPLAGIRMEMDPTMTVTHQVRMRVSL